MINIDNIRASPYNVRYEDRERGAAVESSLVKQNTPEPFSRELVARFVAYCDVKQTTIDGYAVALRHFASWINNPQPGREDIKAYKEYLATATSEETGKPLKAGTQARYLRAVKLFFKWTAAEGLYPNIADNIKPVKVRMDTRHRDALTAADVRRVLDSIDRSSEAGKRDYALTLLCITCAFRMIELHRANIEDIQIIAGRPWLYIQGKGRDEKDAKLEIAPDVYEAIKDYLAERKPGSKTEALFTGTSNRAKGQRITEPGLSRIVKNILRAAGYDSERITAHSLRHTGITLCTKAGKSLRQVQEYARHASPATTEVYIHDAQQEKEHYSSTVYGQIYGAGESLQETFANLSPEEQAAALAFIRAKETLRGQL